jgi:hypothetical protein
MQPTQKSRSKSPASLKSVRGTGAKRAVALSKSYAFALPRSATKHFALNMPVEGVDLALVARNPAAEKKLKAWASDGMGQADWLVAPERGKETKAEANIQSSAYAPNSRARALLQGVKIAEADLKEAGGAFTQAEVQTLLNGVSRQALEKRVKDGSLLAVPGPSNRRRYPAIQFTREGVVPGLKKVREALPTRNPWTILNFLVRSDSRLGGRKPIDVLRNGDVEVVVSAARGMGMQGG